MINFLPLVYLAIVVFHCLIDAYQIEKKGIYINHFKEGCYYGLVCAIVSCILYFVLHLPLSPLIVLPLVTRLAFFNPLLNIFRGKKLNYIGTRSWFDKIETSLNISPSVFIFLFIAIYILYLIIYYGAFT